MKRYRITTLELNYVYLPKGYIVTVNDLEVRIYDRDGNRLRPDKLRDARVLVALHDHTDWFEEISEDQKLYTEADMLEFGNYVYNKTKWAHGKFSVQSKTIWVESLWMDFVSEKGKSGCNSPLGTNE